MPDDEDHLLLGEVQAVGDVMRPIPTGTLLHGIVLIAVPCIALPNLCDEATHAPMVGFSATVYLYWPRFLPPSESPDPTSVEHISLRPRWNR
jgi:hypothetical protein